MISLSSFFPLSATVSFLLHRLGARCCTLSSISSLLVWFCPPHPIVLPPIYLLFSHRCPPINSLFSVGNFELIYESQPSRAPFMNGRSVFDSCHLFDSLMWRRGLAQAESRLFVMLHSCMCGSATQENKYFTYSHRPLLTELDLFSEHISSHTIHLQTFKTEAPSRCPLCLHFPPHQCFSSVSKCFISGAPSVHNTLPPFSSFVCTDLFTYYMLPLFYLSLLPRAESERCPAVGGFPLHLD